MIAEKENHLLYNKNLQPFANKNRKQMTKAEACLWKYVLRGKQMGYFFNRQRPVLNYIADFMCKELNLRFSQTVCVFCKLKKIILYTFLQNYMFLERIDAVCVFCK